MNESLNLILNELCCGYSGVDRFYLIDHFLSFGSKFGQKSFDLVFIGAIRANTCYHQSSCHKTK